MRSLSFRSFRMDGWLIAPCLEGAGVDMSKGSQVEHLNSLDEAVRWVQDKNHVPEMVAVTIPEDELPPKEKGSLVASLVQRLYLYEMRPGRTGSPEDVDAWLRDLIPDDKRLAFYQWVGDQAVDEFVEDTHEDLKKVRASIDNDGLYDASYREGWDDVIERLTVETGYPSKLPVGRPFCNVQWHTHTHGGGRLPSCRLDPVGECNCDPVRAVDGYTYKSPHLHLPGCPKSTKEEK